MRSALAGLVLIAWIGAQGAAVRKYRGQPDALRAALLLLGVAMAVILAVVVAVTKG
jgi:hypothetical protein